MKSLLALLITLPFVATAQPLPPPGSSSGVQAGSHPGYVVNNWYVPMGASLTPGSGWVNPTASRVVCSFGSIAQTITISAIGANVQTVGVGNAQWAIYNNGSWGRPSTPVVASGSVSTNALNPQTIAISQQLPPGGYWWCQNMDNATAIVVTYWALTGSLLAAVGSTAPLNAATGGASATGIYTAQTFGTWPNFTSGTSWTTPTTAIVPAIIFKVGSVP